MSKAAHWADNYAEKIIREKGDKELYVCASGITPSGTVHIGNFREIITVELVVRALRDRGRKVRFIYSWDDYDVFRKVPSNMPNQEMLADYIDMPLTRVPDPFSNEYASFAHHNNARLRRFLDQFGFDGRAHRHHDCAFLLSMPVNDIKIGIVLESVFIDVGDVHHRLHGRGQERSGRPACRAPGCGGRLLESLL